MLISSVTTIHRRPPAFVIYRRVRVSCMIRLSGSTCSSPASDWCNACYNGGSCAETVHGIVCQCPRFWTGPQCKEPVTCNNLPCKQASGCHDYVSVNLHIASLRTHVSGRLTRSRCRCLLFLSNNLATRQSQDTWIYLESGGRFL